jgi:ABC-type glycerol-3-phosphate transport system substrate-binding protein
MRKFCFALAFILISSPLFARSERISFWHGQGFHAKQIIDELVEEYNRTHSDVHVDAVFQGLYQDMEVKMLAAAVTRQLPEVALEQIEYIDLYADEGLLQPIDTVIKEETRKDVYGVMWEAVSREGRTYAVPFCMSTTVLFYNRDVFEQLGLDPDKPPETWEQMIVSLPGIRTATVFPTVSQSACGRTACTDGRRYSGRTAARSFLKTEHGSTSPLQR